MSGMPRTKFEHEIDYKGWRCVISTEDYLAIDGAEPYDRYLSIYYFQGAGDDREMLYEVDHPFNLDDLLPTYSRRPNGLVPHIHQESFGVCLRNGPGLMLMTIVTTNEKRPEEGEKRKDTLVTPPAEIVLPPVFADRLYAAFRQIYERHHGPPNAPAGTSPKVVPFQRFTKEQGEGVAEPPPSTISSECSASPAPEGVGLAPHPPVEQ